MTDENNQIKFFLYENWARTKTGQHTVLLVKIEILTPREDLQVRYLLTKTILLLQQMFEFDVFSTKNYLMKQNKLFQCINIFFQTTGIDKLIE